MYKQVLSLVFIALLISSVGLRTVKAGSTEEKQARHAEKVRTNVAKLGVGEAAVVEVTLRDKSKVKGYISRADSEGFTVANPKTSAATTVVYPNVKSIKGKNLSTGAKIAIGVGIAAAIVFVILYITIVHYDE
jgi:hypothetical protein